MHHIAHHRLRLRRTNGCARAPVRQRLAPPRGLLALLALCALAGCQKPPEVTFVVTPASQAATGSAAAGAASAVAVAGSEAASALPTEGQRRQGAQLAARGAAGAPACSTCHGTQGEGNAAAGYPRLAGQAYEYLRRQLASYADDSRNNAVMAPIAKALSPVQQQATAAWYASLANAPAFGAAAAAAPAFDARGQELAGVGDAEKGVPPCANCHGAMGSGQGAAFPYLAGQNAAYLRAALAAWREGTRRNDASGQMPLVARALGDADIQAVAAFYARLPAPAVPRDAEFARSGAMAANAPGSAASR